MIKAGSLFYAIVISLIIAILSSSLILFAYLSHIEFENFEINQRLHLNAGSGLNLLLSQQSLVNLNEKKTLDLYGRGEDSIQLSRKSWGAYEIAIAKAIFKNTFVLRSAQIGYDQDSSQSYSLYLADEDKPLALCGKTKIKGIAFLPKAGVKRAYIEGQSFEGSQLIDGPSKQSEKTVPEFNKELIANIQSVFSVKQISDEDSILIVENELSGDSLSNSFLNSTLVLLSKSTLRISGGSYSGNIVFISDQQIKVSASAVLRDVMLFAPKVIIEKGFKGNLQIFASDSVLIQKEVSLTYPSVVGVISNEHSPNVTALVTSENDSISGDLFAYKKQSDVLKQTGVLIAEKCFVYGQVYSNGYADVKGEIYGSLMCQKILLNTSSSVYENHLLNAEIDRTKLSGHFVGINLVEESAFKKVVKWMY